MDKTLSLSHKDFELVEPRASRAARESYGEADLFRLLPYSGSAARRFRMMSFGEYEKMEFPAWKRTSLEALEFPPLDEEPPVRIAGGISFKSMNSSTYEDLAMIRTLDFEGSDRKFVNMADAFYNSGVVVNVAKNDRAGVPFVVSVNGEAPTVMSNLFVLREDATMTVVVWNKTQSVFSLMNNRFFVGERASLNLLFINEAHSGSFLFNNAYYLLSEGARLNMFDVNLSARTTATCHVSRLNGDSSISNNWALYSAAGNSTVDLSYTIKHGGRNTSGLIEGVGVIGGAARSVFRGTLEIGEGAKGTNSSEHSDTLLISDKAVSDAIPSLSVSENDVEASHAATVGSMDEDAVYYLQNRGLTKEEAEKLIIIGRFDPMIEKIHDTIGNGFDGGVRGAVLQRLACYSQRC